MLDAERREIQFHNFSARSHGDARQRRRVRHGLKIRRRHRASARQPHRFAGDTAINHIGIRGGQLQRFRQREISSVNPDGVAAGFFCGAHRITRPLQRGERFGGRTIIRIVALRADIKFGRPKLRT